MATLLLTLTSGVNVASRTLTFNGTDSQRILNAFQNRVQPNGTLTDLVNWLGDQASALASRLVTDNETTINIATPPTIT